MGRDADSGIEAALILDRIGADIDGMVIRPDVDQFYYSGDPSVGENDKMYFYSQVTGYFPTDSTSVAYYKANQSAIALVGYRINTTDNSGGIPTLERLARGLTASADNNPNGATTAPMQFLTFPSRTSVTSIPGAVGGSITNQWGNDEGQSFPDVGSVPYDNGTSPYYHAIGSQVFRMQICFQLQSGIFSQYPGYTNCAPTYPEGITNNLAVVVAIATLDSKSQKLIPAASWSKMIKALPSPSAANFTANPPVLMESLWNSKLPSLAAVAGISPLAASHVKVYQRYYYLNAPQAH